MSKAAETEARELESWSEDERDGDRERHQEERGESLVRERHRNRRHRGWIREVDTQNQSPRIKGDTEYRERMAKDAEREREDTGMGAWEHVTGSQRQTKMQRKAHRRETTTGRGKAVRQRRGETATKEE